MILGRRSPIGLRFRRCVQYLKLSRLQNARLGGESHGLKRKRASFSALSFSSMTSPIVAKPAVGAWAEHVRSAPVHQTSTCSAIAKASSTSMPRYLAVLSILVWPGNGCTAPRRETTLKLLALRCATWLFLLRAILILRRAIILILRRAILFAGLRPTRHPQ